MQPLFDSNAADLQKLSQTMIPAKYAPLLFGLVLSMCMSCIVSGVSTLSSVGPVDGFFGLWGGAWLKSWTVAFPVVLLIAPLAGRKTDRQTGWYTDNAS